MFGFYRISAAVPRVRLCDVEHNVATIKKFWQAADNEQHAVIAFPELAVTGYSCGDLFFQSTFMAAAQDGLQALVKFSAALKTVAIVGCPMESAGRLYNCAVVIQQGNILGVVPKSFIANYREFYEKRWFASGANLTTKELHCGGTNVPFGVDLLFTLNSEFVFGVEICEDLWNPISPSTRQALAGATINFNISASTEYIGKADFRKKLVLQQSAKCMSVYAYTSAGVGESTSDVVFGGHALVAENGQILAENARFSWTGTQVVADVDCQKLAMLRQQESSFADNSMDEFRRIAINPLKEIKQLNRQIPKLPFFADSETVQKQRCAEIFAMQSVALARRLEHSQIKNLVLGISGGMDSTLALLVSVEALAILGLPPKNVFAVTMPGFGTSDLTLENAKQLVQGLGATLKIIDIRPACEQHFKDIEFEPKNLGVLFENVQARERTQVLMDLANKHQGLVVGTGDLSEFALGWTTFSGDHISNYNVNIGVPKTLVRSVINWYSKEHEKAKNVCDVLERILATPITPELLPHDGKENIPQKTEEIVGPYELHDFFLFHFLRYGAAPAKILFLAEQAFGKDYKTAEIEKWLKVFLTRFFAHQFKRNVMVDGPKIGTIALSPRGDWRMPADAHAEAWLKS